LPSTIEFLAAFADVRKSHISDPVLVVRGGNNLSLQGTWLHEDVALEFARGLILTLSLSLLLNRKEKTKVPDENS